MTTTTKGEETAHVKEAPPPWHSVALLGVFVAVFTALLPSWESIDKAATVETFTNRVFPNVISLEALGWIRASFALLIFGLTFHATFVWNGWVQITSYLPQSKLNKKVSIPMHGIRTQLPFTSWSWNLLGVAFSLQAAIALLVAYGHEDWVLQRPWILRAALLVFETAAPTALLVTFVVRYAIWPRLFKASGDTSNLRQVHTLLWHNANVIMVLAEVSLLGTIPVRFSDFAVSPFFGLTYILFSWSRTHQWVPDAGPQFLYFFLDTTLGRTTSIAMSILLLVLMLFYGLFGVIHNVLHHLGGAVVSPLTIIIVSSVVCRFRD